MKKKILTVFVLTAMVTVAAFGQGFGVRGTFNLVNLYGDDTESKLKPGFNVGAFYEITVAPDFYFQPNLLFSMKGANADEGDGKLNLGYVELPLHFMYKPKLGTGNIVVGFGPYFAYGVTGKYKVGDEEADIKFKNDVSIDDDEDALYYKGLDAGADIFFGYEFPFKVSLLLNAQIGLSNLNPKLEGEDPDESLKNIGFGLSLGYRF